MPSQNEIIKAMNVIQMDPKDYDAQKAKVFGWKRESEPTQEEIDEAEQDMVMEMLNVGLIISGTKKGGLFNKNIMTPKAIKKYRELGYSLHKATIKPGFVLIFLSRKDPKIRDWKNHIAVGNFLSYMTPGDLEEIEKIPENQKYGVSIEVQYRYNGGKIHKVYEMTQWVVHKTKKEIENYLQPFVDALKAMPTPKEIEIVKVIPKITR